MFQNFVRKSGNNVLSLLAMVSETLEFKSLTWNRTGSGFSDISTHDEVLTLELSIDSEKLDV